MYDALNTLAHYLTTTVNHRALSRLKPPITWPFVQELVKYLQQRIIKCLHYWPFERRTYRWRVDSPHNEPVIRITDIDHNVILHIRIIAEATIHTGTNDGTINIIHLYSWPMLLLPSVSKVSHVFSSFFYIWIFHLCLVVGLFSVFACWYYLSSFFLKQHTWWLKLKCDSPMNPPWIMVSML